MTDRPKELKACDHDFKLRYAPSDGKIWAHCPKCTTLLIGSEIELVLNTRIPDPKPEKESDNAQ